MKRQPAHAVLAAALLLVASGCAPGRAGAQEDPPTPRPHVYEVSPEHLAALAQAADSARGTLEVSGSAEVSVPADQALVSFAVETEAPTAREASSQNAEKMDAVIRALREAGVQGLEVETHGYNLSPRYARPPRESPEVRTIAGYTALNHVGVTAGDVGAVGRLIDSAVGAGANRVASLRFQASSTEEARLRALRMAVEKARSEARVIAESMGVTLGRPLSVTGGAQTPQPPGRAYMAMAEAQTPVEPGSQTVTATVTITYRLEPGGR